MTLQSHSWAYIQRITWSEKIHSPQCSLKHCLQQPRHESKCPSTDIRIKKMWYMYERVTGRKARGLQTKEIGCKCQTFFISLLSGRRKQTSHICIFFPLLYTNLKGVSLKILCCHNDTWFHLKLTILKPWVNQCILLMEMFVLSYVNVLCI